jgi:hypothetical protein
MLEAREVAAPLVGAEEPGNAVRKDPRRRIDELELKPRVFKLPEIFRVTRDKGINRRLRGNNRCS